MTVGTDLLNAPFPEMVKSLGVGIAEAQFELDLVSMKIARMMAGFMPDDEDPDTPPPANNTATRDDKMLVPLGDGNSYSLLELGFTPTFYQFVDTMIELKMSISMSRETNTSKSFSNTTVSASGSVGFFSAKARVSATSVSASYAQKYQYSAEGSSLMRTKLVPVPPPPILEERIRAMITPSA
jgi:hypothetical protein